MLSVRCCFVFLWLACLPWQADAGGRWTLGPGLSVLQLPDYRGSAQTQWYVLPFPYISYESKRFRLTRGSASGVLWARGPWLLDLSLGGGLPVKSSAGSVRSGMPDLDPTLELGPMLCWRCKQGSWRLKVSLRGVFAVNTQDFLPHQGWLLLPGLEWKKEKKWAKNDSLTLKWSLTPLWADRRMHAYYYAVSRDQASARRSVYSGKAGYSGVKMRWSLSRRWQRYWLGWYLRVDRLEGAAFANSPLVERPFYWSSGLAVSWLWVTPDER